ncbi:MAG: RNA methyltransferase [Burkholderiales bacterium]|nr:RNA methyltransferase [Burkholderiales bacterium]
MNLPQTVTSLFKRLRFVLVETSHPGNIGAAARAIKTMGFSELVLVNPRFDYALTDPEAIAFASGAQDILASAKIVSSIEQALAGCHFVAAVSARLREFSPPVLSPRALAENLSGQIQEPVAIVFGNERYGLPNEIVVKCNALINIPANPDYSSLNLAQAIQLLAYECRVAQLGDAGSVSPIGFHGDLASADEIDRMYAHLEQALVAINFLDPAHPKKLMPRLRRLFSRTQLETEEVNILRGIAKKILDGRKD